MTVFNFSVPGIVKLSKLNAINILILSMAMLFVNIDNGVANTNAKANKTDKTITGQSGGSTDSQGCGFVPSTPSYEMNVEQRIDYMRLTVQTNGGQPTLLVVGPNPGDSFCVLGDEVSGLKPEISGVWEAGYYQIYVGDRTGSRHQFTLDISTDN
ncbi:MAG: hypothetical protein ACFCU7_14275 [Pleurocapsa sp.]